MLTRVTGFGRVSVVALWVSVLVLGSIADSETKAALGTQGQYHRLWHMFTFCTTTIVLGWGLVPPLRGGQAAGGAFALGLFCEILQRLIYIPVIEWEDVRDDGLGSVAGWLLLLVMRRWFLS